MYGGGAAGDVRYEVVATVMARIGGFLTGSERAKERRGRLPHPVRRSIESRGRRARGGCVCAVSRAVTREVSRSCSRVESSRAQSDADDAVAWHWSLGAT